MSPSSPPTSPTPNNLQDQIWFALVLVVYALVELSFNHRMLELTDGVLSNQDLDGLQFWGRLIAGFGMSMLLLRWLDLRMTQRWQAVVLSFALGMTVMWHFQKMVIDHLVANAPEAEKKLSVYLLNIADLGAAGQLTFQGQALGQTDMPISVRESVKTLLPAAALGASLSDFQAPASGWGTQAPALPMSASPELLDNAYRNTITPPIALGLSSFFGLLNLAQGLGLALLITLRQKGHPRWAGWLRRHLLALTAAITLGLTLGHRDAFIDSPGYAQQLSPIMWQHNAVLAGFIAWNLRAEPTWYPLSAWAHRELLGGFLFAKL
jgi:hypothetical protein